VNACEQSLANTPKRPPETTVPGVAPTLPEQPTDALSEALGRGRRADRWLLARLLSSLGSPPIELAVRGGARVQGGTPIARVTFENRSTLLWILADVWLRFGDAYSDGRVTVEGDLVRVLETVYCAGRRASAERDSLARRAAHALQRPHLNTLAGSRDNIHHHYDIGNAFYELWLGSTMAYTCAYYPEPTATLDEAQVAKMDHVCRKLRLKPGESVVEAGCGWGMLAMHMARHYGVRVRAFNISREQILWARERAAREGLADRVEYVEDDYRNIGGQYDAFVSVGMLEHVGVKNYTTLGAVIHRCLGGRGRGLIHSIGRNHPATLNPWIEKRIFPGGHPPAPSEMARIFEPWDLSILDVENLRLHYAQTLRHWLTLFEGASERVRAMFDDKFVRMWRLYLAGSVAGFTTGSLQLFQVVFAPGESNDIPWTRAHLYTR
jgi:cyclopropane-fatty-acyl-phospholipid synthase